MRRRRLVAIYPEYLDGALTRSQGRRVPASLAVNEPSLKKIQYALRKLGLEHYPEPAKAYSRDWWTRQGRVLVDKGDLTKTQLITEVAKIARKLKKVEKKEDTKATGKKAKYKTKPKVRKPSAPRKPSKSAKPPRSSSKSSTKASKKPIRKKSK